MPRNPKAMDVLISEIQSAYDHDVSFVLSELDGFGVHRGLGYDGADTPGFAAVAAALEADKRIAYVSTSGEDVAIGFTSGPSADRSEPFGIDKVLLSQPEDPIKVREAELKELTLRELKDQFDYETGTKKEIIAEILEQEFSTF